ncbi:MAG: TolC family protein [Desulforhopalus sp.]
MAVKAAQDNDPWLVGNRHSQDAIESLSVAAGTLPDPKMSVGLLNLPTDTFDFSQEPMTRFNVGVSQMFPRGDSLAIKQKQLELVGSQFPFQRQDRRAKVVVSVSQLWLDAYNAQESIALIEKDRPLFEQLVDVAEASYSSALGKTRQQDIIRAQLELTQLEDRLTVLRQKQEVSVEKLSEWLSEYFLNEYQDKTTTTVVTPWSRLELDKELPNIKMLDAPLFTANNEASPQTLFEHFSQHPLVAALEQQIKASKAGIDLARQKYKPEWGLNVSYGYRDADRSGNDLADFFSVGGTFDLPLFTSNRQDKELQSAVSETEAIKTKKWLLVRKMIADFEKSRAKLLRLNERQKLFQIELLPQFHEQAEASLTAYTNDDGDFAEVVRARIAELNALIDALSIDVERQKAIIELNYFFMKTADDIIASNRPSGEMK